jgi:DNA-directed RNA polymerase sigma subunit (sigma70/sigma32)
MLLWLAKQDRHGMTGAGVVTEFVELEHDTDEKEGLTIDETSYVEESISAEQLVRAIDITPAYDRALLIEYYGLKGRKPLTRRQLAAKRRVSDAVMRGLLASALRELNKSLRSMGIDSEAV